MVKNPSANAGDVGLVLGTEDPLQEGIATHSSSCLENPMDRGAWRAAVLGVAKKSDMTERLTLPVSQDLVGFDVGGTCGH